MSTTAVTTESVAERLGVGRGHVIRLNRSLIWVLLALGIVVAAAWFWTRPSASPGTSYITQAVSRGNLTATVTATGTLAPINQVDVGSELSGIVKVVTVDDNDQVRVGQILARLDTTKLDAQVSQIRASLASARARVQQAQATVEEARAQFSRASQLSARQLIARSDLDTARATLERAEADRTSAAATVAQAEATLQATQTDLTKTTIRSPINGVVLKRNIEPGQTVAASFQAPVLFTLAQELTQMELKIDVDEPTLDRCRPERDPRSRGTLPGSVFTASDRSHFSLQDNVASPINVRTGHSAFAAPPDNNADSLLKVRGLSRPRGSEFSPQISGDLLTKGAFVG